MYLLEVTKNLSLILEASSRFYESSSVVIERPIGLWSPQP